MRGSCWAEGRDGTDSTLPLLLLLLSRVILKFFFRREEKGKLAFLVRQTVSL